MDVRSVRQLPGSAEVGGRMRWRFAQSETGIGGSALAHSTELAGWFRDQVRKLAGDSYDLMTKARGFDAVDLADQRGGQVFQSLSKTAYLGAARQDRTLIIIYFRP